MTASAKTLREQKLPVFLVDTALSSNDYDAAFLTDNLEAGAEVCQQMVEQMKASGVKESEEQRFWCMSAPWPALRFPTV